MTTLIIQRFFRTILITLLGMSIFVGATCFLLFPPGKAGATIFWEGGLPTDSSIVEKLGMLPLKPISGGPVTLNANDGHYLVLEADQEVPTLLSQLEKRFTGSNDIRVGRGTKAGFFTVQFADRICAMLLIRDFNRGKTLIFSVIAPETLFKGARDPFVDQEGVDPVPDLRPPGSTRLFCFETPAFAFAAYRSVQGRLTDFYQTMFSTAETPGMSIMSFTDAKLPKAGDLYFFEKAGQRGFVTFQSNPVENCSYAIVCAQAN